MKKNIIKYSIAGAISTIISYISFCIMIKLEINYIQAYIVSYLLGASTNIYTNTTYTFKRKLSIKTSLRLLAIHIASLAFGILIIDLIISHSNMTPYYAQIIVIFIRFPTIYFIKSKILSNQKKIL